MAGILHGGGLSAACARYGGQPADWLDLSTGINPSMVALPEIPAAVWNRLPDKALEQAAREAAWDWCVSARGVPPSVLPVPGTQSFIQILPKLVPADRPVAILSPTYGEYAHCFRRAGMMVDAIGSLDELTDAHGTLVIVNPNNPTGGTFLHQELIAMAARMGRQDGHLHIDEAFGDARPELSLAAFASETSGVTVSRSFGKFFGLAGLRLGFVFAVPTVLDTVEAALGPWAVSGPALFLARELMRGDRAGMLSQIEQRRTALGAVLDAAGLEAVGGTELFALVRHNRAQALFEHLAGLHILVRKFDYAGDWLRIGLTPDEQGDRRLAQALASAQF